MVEFLASFGALRGDFWYAVSFVLFVGLAYRPGRRAIVRALDAKIKEIADTVGEAKTLLGEAEGMHREAEQAAARLDKECETMRANAAAAAATTATRLLASLDEELKRREVLAEQNIKEAEQAEILRIQLRLGADIAADTRRLLRGSPKDDLLAMALTRFKESDFEAA